MSTAHSIPHQQHELYNNSIRGADSGTAPSAGVPASSAASTSSASATLASSSSKESSSKNNESKPSIRSTGPNRFRGDAAAFNPSQQPYVPTNINGLHSNAGAGGPQYPMYSAQTYMYPQSMPPMPQYYSSYPYMIPAPLPGNMPGGAAANPGYDAYFNFYNFNQMAMAMSANGGYPMQPTIPNGSGGNNYANRLKTKRNTTQNAVNSNNNGNYSNAMGNTSIPSGSKVNVSNPATPKNIYASTTAGSANLVNKSSSASNSAKNLNEQKTNTNSVTETFEHDTHYLASDINEKLETVPEEANTEMAKTSSSSTNDINEKSAQDNENGTKSAFNSSTTVSSPSSPKDSNTTSIATTELHDIVLPLFFNTSKELVFEATKSNQPTREELKNAKNDQLTEFVNYSRSKNSGNENGVIVYPNTALKIIDYSNNSTVVTLPNSWAGPLYSPESSKAIEELISTTTESKESDVENTSEVDNSLDLSSAVTSPLVVQSNWAAFLQSTPAAKKKATSSKPKLAVATTPISAQTPSHSSSSGAFDLSNESAQPLGILLLRVMFDSHYSIFNSSTPKFDIHPRGLTNTGNICYMNSILQVLLYCDPFNRLIKIISEMTVGSLDKSKSKTPLLDATINLFNQFQAKLPTNSNGMSNGYVLKSVSPEQFYTKLISHKKFQHLKWGQQEDAEEFLGYFLDAITEELLGSIGDLNSIQVDSLIQLYPGDDINEFQEKVKTTMQLVKKEGPSYTSNNDEDSSEDDDGDSGWSEVGSKKKKVSVRRNGEEEPTPMTEIFGGQFRNVLTIPKSSKHSNYLKSITLDPFRNIQLDLSESNSIEDALIHLNKVEKINYKPLDDKEELIVLKQTFIDKLPQVLTIHLKRFAFADSSSEDNNGYGNGRDSFSNNLAAPSHSTAGSSGSFTSVAAATTTATTASTTTVSTTTASTTTASTSPNLASAPSNGRSNGYTPNYGGYGYGSGINKLRKKITYEHELTIPAQVFSPQAHIVESPRYRLIGVVYHHGSSMESGHYTCDVRVDRAPGKEEWIRIDDTLIEPVSASDVLNVDEATRNAYILFYEHI